VQGCLTNLAADGRSSELRSLTRTLLFDSPAAELGRSAATTIGEEMASRVIASKLLLPFAFDAPNGLAANAIASDESCRLVAE
jgi:hypothetical protein